MIDVTSEKDVKKAWMEYKKALDNWSEFIKKEATKNPKWMTEPYNPYSSPVTNIVVSSTKTTEHGR